jgi:glutamyl-tRNA reductase
MNVILVGMNHKTAPLEIRERLSFACGDNVRPLEEILRAPAVKEALYLSTCNRVEVLARAEDMEEAIARVKDFILRHGNLDTVELERCLYVYCGSDAVRHLFRVTSSLDSMVMGEPQILGQMKEAYRDCLEQKSSGIILNKLLHHAFRAAKRVRTETAIANNAVSVSFAAVEMAKKVLGSLEGKSVLLVGAGEMSELAARHLLSNGVGKIFVVNRTYSRAVQVAEEFQGIPSGFDHLEEKLREADIVISSTGAAGHIITPAMIHAALRRRKNRLLFLIDIAVPRDVDPEVGRIDNVYLFNIDDLQGVVDENLRNRLKEADKAEVIIGEEVLKFAEWYNTLEVVPTIVSLREKVESILRAEMEKSGSWLRTLGEEDRKNVEILTTQIINKILHDPVTGLKEESQSNGAMPYVAAIRKLFRLDPQETQQGEIGETGIVEDDTEGKEQEP